MMLRDVCAVLELFMFKRLQMSVLQILCIFEKNNRALAEWLKVKANGLSYSNPRWAIDLLNKTRPLKTIFFQRLKFQAFKSSL